MKLRLKCRGCGWEAVRIGSKGSLLYECSRCGLAPRYEDYTPVVPRARRSKSRVDG